jgi:hypothetical protein
MLQSLPLPLLPLSCSWCVSVDRWTRERERVSEWGWVERESECYGDSVSHEMVVASLTCGARRAPQVIAQICAWSVLWTVRMSVGRFVRARIVWKVLSLCKCSGKMFRWCVRWSAEASNAHKCAISSQLVSEFEFKMQMMLMMMMNKWRPRHDINCAKNKQQNGQERGQIGTSYSRPRSVESCLSPLTLRPAHPLLLRFTNEGCI